MRNPLTQLGAVEEFQGVARSVACKPSICRADGIFALSAALSAQGGAENSMESTEQPRAAIGPPGRYRRAKATTGRPHKAWPSRRRKRNAESRPS